MNILNIKKISFKMILTIMLVFMLFMINNIFAGSLSVSSSSTSLTEGDKSTITIKATDIAGSVNITVSDTSVGTISSSSEFLDDGSTTITFTSKSAGTATITVTPVDMTDYDSLENYTKSSSVKITVKEEVVEEEKEESSSSSSSTTSVEKSSDNYLSSLDVNIDGLTPDFSKYTNTYTLTVENDVEKLDLDYTLSDSKASATVSGNEDFEVGENTVKITVKSESGYSRSYTILVTREEIKDEENSFLKNLIIEGYSFEDGFNSDKFEYNLGDISVNILNILAYPEIEDAKVQIIGNDSIIDGENTITIKITSTNGENTSEYNITFNNTLPLVEEVEDEQEEEILPLEDTDDENNFMANITNWFGYNGLYIMLLLCILLEFVQIVYLYLKLNKKCDIIDTDFKNENSLSNSIIDTEKESTEEAQEKNVESFDENEDVLEDSIVEETKNILNENPEENDDNKMPENIFEEYIKENMKKEKENNLE